MIQNFLKAWRNRLDRERIYSESKFWDEKAEAYTGNAISMFANDALNDLCQRDQFAFIESSLPDLAGKRVLDAGCGTGRLSRHLASLGAIVTAVDFSHSAIEIARSHSDTKQIDYRVGSLHDVALDGPYDAIVTLASVTVACRSLDEFQTLMQRFRSILSSSGKLLLVEPFQRGFLHRVLNADRSEIEATLSSAGFHVHTTVEMHFWPVRFPLSHINLPAFITCPAYRLGERLLRLPPFRHWGDYKCIVATPIARQ